MTRTGAPGRPRAARGGLLLASLVAAALALLTPSVPETFAFTTIPGVRWPGGEATFRVNPNFPDAGVAGTSEQQIEFIRCAAAAWRDQSRASFRFTYQGTTTRSGFNLNDGVNAVSWVNAEDPEALAATVIGRNGAGQLSFDIVFFARTGGRTNTWSGPGEPGSGRLDITGVAAHELGHGLGLDHEEDVPAATMFPAVMNRGLTLRTLHDDDRAGVESLYGARTSQPPAVSIASANPGFGPASGGNEVVLTGANFTYDSETTLRIGGTALSTNHYEVETCNRIRIFDMPAHASGDVDITVVNSIGTATLAAAYEYGGSAPPALSSVEPTEGPLDGGLTVTVTGENFSPEARITIGGRPLLDPVFIDSQTITGTLPPSEEAGPVDVRVEQDGNASVLADAFTYNPFLLRIAEASAVPGQAALPVDVLASSPGPLSSISFGFRYDPALLSVRRIDREGTAAAEAEFIAANIDNPGGVTTVGLVMSFQGIEPVIPAGSDVLIGRIVCSIDAAAEPGESAALELGTGLGTPPIDLTFTRPLDSTPIRPLTVDGRVTIVAGQVFIRGDANGDGEINLSDATFGLNNLFLGGPPPRPCGDSADFNDSGTRDVSDAVYLLNFLFLGGPRPPPPFPFRGPDPTPDPIDC
jgi:hypothetical protein